MSRSLIPNSTQIPDVILDEWMSELEGAELKVVLYIARRTFGFGKRSDTISVSQMAHGIKTSDGETLDKGTGLSFRGVQEACNYLVECKVLLRRVNERNNMPSAYAINLRWEGELIDRKKWRARNKNAAQNQENTAPEHELEQSTPATVAPPQRLHPRNEQQSTPATVAPTRDSIQETEKRREEPPDTKKCPAPKGPVSKTAVKVDAVKKPSRFVRDHPPSLEEIRDYFETLGRPDLAEGWLDHFLANGWKVSGKSPMEDWKASCRTWKRFDKKREEENKVKAYGNRNEIPSARSVTAAAPLQQSVATRNRLRREAEAEEAAGQACRDGPD